ncbi:hypothetical protein SBRCBS47491_002370 [Sporothrix bragantina]|uniref:Beta-lactamase-related domain-containing protein n=1 Tax=Sporothrix bragantina TaxID=671064 RepID=A0ABP0B6C2_9PEZI
MSTIYDDGLAGASPESAGIRSADISAFLDDLETSGVEVHTLMLYRAGSVVAEGSWWPYRADRPHMMHSATKSFLSVAVGLAIEEGFFALDSKVVDIFPEQAASATTEISANLGAMTVKDLVTQTSGHAHGVSGGQWRSIATSWIAEFFKLPAVHTPGTKFVYTSATSFLLSAIISTTTGMSVREFLEPRFCQPLGIKLLAWDVGPDNICSGGNGISCLPSDFLKLGILHLQKGKWNGKQILPVPWTTAATTSQRGNPYGYHWWTSPEGPYWASGFFGQMCYVFPEHDAVLVTTSAVPHDVGLQGTHVEGITTLSGAKLHHGYEYPSMRVVATAAWTKPDTLQMVLQFVESAFRDTITVRFFIDKNGSTSTLAQLDRSVNVNSFKTQRPPLFGAVLRTGKELASPQLKAVMDAAKATMRFSTSGSTVGELLSHPASKAILEQEIPDIMQNPRIDKARMFTLDLIMRHAGLTEEDLARINKKLAAIGANE